VVIFQLEQEVHMRHVIYVYFFALLALYAPARAEIALKTDALSLAVTELFEKERDLLDPKLAVDAIVSPGIDNQYARAEIARLTGELMKLLPPGATPHQKLRVLKQFIYEPGPWNDMRHFAYDLSDPLGKKSVNRLMSHYLKVRRGNCVTMPMLLAILGKRIGLNMTLATAPQHVFAKFTDGQGKVWNLEATSGAGYTRDSHYQTAFPFTDLAVATGVYLRALKGKELTAMVAHDVLIELMQEGRYREIIRIAEILEAHDSRSIHAKLTRASAYGRIFEIEILPDLQSNAWLLPEDLERANRLLQMNHQVFAEAERMGWTERDGLKPGQVAMELGQ
jgi:Transglutaminase-like superfamily